MLFAFCVPCFSGWAVRCLPAVLLCSGRIGVQSLSWDSPTSERFMWSDVLSLLSLPLSWHKIHIKSLQNLQLLHSFWLCTSCVGPLHFTDRHIRYAPASPWWASWHRKGLSCHLLSSLVILSSLAPSDSGGLWCVSQLLGRAAGSGLSRHSSIRASALRH